MRKSSLRRGVLFASCVAAVVVAPSLFAGSDVWTAKLMQGYKDWPNVAPNDINESGKIVGYATDGSGNWVGLTWSSATSAPVALAPLSGDTDTWTADVNANGTVCGVSGVMFAKPWRAVTWDDKGKVTDRHPADWAYSDMWSLNNAGEGAGEVVSADGWWFACYWPAKGDAVLLDLPAAYAVSWALCINKNGLIAGDAYPYGPPHACYWDGPDGDLVDIHDAVEDAYGADLWMSQGYEVTDQDEIVGFAFTSDNHTVSFVYTAADGARIFDAGDEADALAWQSAGKYVVGGVGGDPYSTGMTEQAAIWERGTKKGKTTWTLQLIEGLKDHAMTAVGANVQGNIVGAAQGSDGITHPWYAKRSGK